MSNQRQSRSTSKPAHANRGSSARSSASKTTTTKKASKKVAVVQPPVRKPLLGARVKNDLIGLVMCILAVVLLVIVLMPAEAVGARVISDALHMIFGTGAHFLPVLLFCWGITFFVKQRLTNSPVRLAIGLAVIYMALIAIFGVMTPLATSDPGRIFQPLMLINQGGYVGGAIAWALLSLVGFVATVIILVGLILIGLVQHIMIMHLCILLIFQRLEEMKKQNSMLLYLILIRMEQLLIHI